ncbi:NADH:flavin oxidoreductase/NADH oxidase family protein [Nocardia stercoris]|uniref:NADH:flavin oxidoreductase/NADH oxidase family protein n=1 Tax=Nocardia stercoris TaxID=2483361 RepID=A0A3M2LDD8_9NOCA|nr:NADH:flavin oxidoreductase/NADH oxidase family protein [Nocardia stercoris]RMI32708.1 NADH:flavin oxidoreductase/NADH oxidase family protein [Nocardia stercoris]
MTDTTTARTLTDPVALPCGQHLPNRLMKSALSEALGDRQGRPTPQLERLYRTWAAGGFGLVVTGNVMIDGRQLGEAGNVVIEDDRHLDALRRVTAPFDDTGTKLWMQINHPGRQANPFGRRRPVAPSAIAPGIPVATRPRELTGAEIHEIIERFATTAAVAEAAGFHGVQIHGAHGYLISQFLSPLANQRDDEWGGDAERRRRFVLEVVQAIRGRVSPGFAVGIKLNSADFQRGGFTEDESRDVVRMLAAENLDLIEISGGSYESPAMMGAAKASTVAREAYFLDYARTVADLAGAVPVAVTGGFRSFTGMSEAVASGGCDVVGLGRPTALVPDAADALLSGRLPRLETKTITVPFADANPRLRPLQSMIDLQWYTDQLHRIGAGDAPDPNRAWWQTALSTVRRNGSDSLRPKRG